VSAFTLKEEREERERERMDALGNPSPGMTKRDTCEMKLSDTMSLTSLNDTSMPMFKK